MRNTSQLRGFGDLAGLIALVVGIASVVALLCVTEVEKVEVKRKFEKTGVNNIVFRFNQEKSGSRIRLKDASTIKNEVPGIEMATPLIIRRESVTLQKRKVDIQVVGVTADFFTINGLAAGGGRLLSDLDAGILRCSLGANVVKTLVKAGYPVKPGSTLRIGSWNFMVIGFLRPVDGMEPPVNADNVIFIHSQTAQNIFEKNANVDIIQVRVYSGVGLKAVSGEILKRLDAGKAAKVFATSGEDMMASMQRWGRLFIMFFGLTGAVSLVLGGARLMNFLLERVNGRKAEIIVKRALGVKGFDIQMSYLLQALSISLITGVAGSVLGVFVAGRACAMAGWSFFITGDPIVIGIGISVIFGLLLGTYPAVRASQLDITMALKP